MNLRESIENVKNKISNSLIKDNIDYGKPFLGQPGKFGIVSFGTDVPEVFVRQMVTPSLRSLGMQMYTFMDPKSGLFFPHEAIQSVTYHMGATAFPIDILFLGLDSDNFYTITKIASDIKPGSTDLFSQNRVAAVLETAGGFTREYGIRPGDGLYIEDLFFSSFPQKPIQAVAVRDAFNIVSSFDFESNNRLQKMDLLDTVYLVDPVGNRHDIFIACGIPREKVIWRNE